MYRPQPTLLIRLTPTSQAVRLHHNSISGPATTQRVGSSEMKCRHVRTRVSTRLFRFIGLDRVHEGGDLDGVFASGA